MTISNRDNVCLGSAGLAIGSTTSQLSTARAVRVLINGRAFNVPVTATRTLTLTGVTSLAARQTSCFFVMADSSGTITTQQSPVYTAIDAPSGYRPGAFEWPDPADKAVIGAIVIKSGASAFVPGTTALTGVATYIDAAVDYGKSIAF